jgi:hypothetical protein
VFSLNVALHLALVPSDALSIHLLSEPLHSWTHSCSPVSLPHTQYLSQGPRHRT